MAWIASAPGARDRHTGLAVLVHGAGRVTAPSRTSDVAEARPTFLVFDRDDVVDGRRVLQEGQRVHVPTR